MRSEEQLTLSSLITDITIGRIRDQVRLDFSNNERAHDYDHARRVAELAKIISADEGGDPAVAQVAALVHDYHRLMPNRGLQSSADDAWPMIENVLMKNAVSAQVQSLVLTCVGFTDRYRCAGHQVHPPSLEAAAVQDADNLDAIGAIGIARAFTFGAHLDEPIWVEDVPWRPGTRKGWPPRYFTTQM